ncbi:DUF1015 domain-containing protein [Frigoriflavimonas asaccharolytica]|uniref:Uncharacterized protein (DUF1015 family) n=1 Tax=Frigoriflavimonas asaccharolytica TaxID=2735899 RepID=A0A8J8G8T0_9FLAO|nr:DUF1015 domain-containing protein [Frigoriflavimonas asaccharolytica]NRS93036.1 uncharacterized protein (DUF1015 family) [Frigoriflavimonas asaccharolytica]
MPIFKPFRGVRPQENYIDIFPTHPLDNYSQLEINKKAQQDSSYVQMIKPYVVSKSKDVDRNLRKIRTNYEELVADKKLMQDNSSYYLYEQIYPNKTVFRGLLGLTSVEEFIDGKIKKHESTIKKKKAKLAHYLEKVNLQAEPVLLTYQSNSRVELLMNHEEKNLPLFSYEDSKNIKHKLWKIDNRLKMQQLKEAIADIDAFYIADGHHRIGSTALNAKFQKEKNKKHTGQEHYNFVYSFIVSNQSIKINDFNRIAKNLHGLTAAEFLKKLETSFNIYDKGETPYFPSKKFHISMYLEGKFYSLHVKHELRSEEIDINHLDHHLLDTLIFKNIYGIENTDASEDITYLKGNSTVDGIVKLKEFVDENDFAAGFGVYPVSFKEILQISDNKITMPPKCTYIEPKLITALLMYDMK